MAFTYGFYNSLLGDRKYNTTDISKLFDGIINDGVFAKVGERFFVKPVSGMTVAVGSGRAWFDSTWNYNDSDYSLTIDDSESVLNRIDTIVIEVNRNLDFRENKLRIVSGISTSENPEKPELLRTEDLNQYPIAHIRVNKGITEITAADITYLVGVTSECPFVTGPLTTVTMEDYLIQWSAEWEQWKAGKNTDFDSWFSNIQDTLGEDVAGSLLDEITSLSEQTALDIAAAEIGINANLSAHSNSNVTAHGVSRGRSNFVGGNSEITIPHGLEETPISAYAIPVSNPQGYLGEVWIRVDDVNIYVGNSGSYSGEMSWTAII